MGARWATRRRSVLRGVHEASSEQVKPCATIHGALDQREAVHLPFGLAVAPPEEQWGEHRIVIAAQSL